YADDRSRSYGESRNRPYADDRSRSYDDYPRERYGRGRFGERADYDIDEPRYGYPEGHRESDYRRSAYDRDYDAARSRSHERPARSRLRCRDIMTRDLAVATRDTMARQVAIMMKEEDTGVIPVVDYPVPGGDGGKTTESHRSMAGNHHYGKLVGLIT